MEDSIFTKIVKGEIPCFKVYEDDEVLAFLNIRPVSSGHSLVIPKKQIQFVWDLDDDLYVHVMDVSRKVAHRMKEVLNVPYVGSQIVGTDVPHAHVHIIPFSDSSVFFIRPSEITEPPKEELVEMAKRLYFG